METLSQHFDESDQVPLEGSVLTCKITDKDNASSSAVRIRTLGPRKAPSAFRRWLARAAESFSFARYLHTLKMRGFYDNNGAPIAMNYIYKASCLCSDSHFESLNHTQGGLLGFIYLANDRATMEKLFSRAHSFFLGPGKNDLYAYLMDAYDGFGLEMGLIHTDNPKTSFIKILGNQFGPLGFLGRFIEELREQHPALFENTHIWFEDFDFFEYSYCDSGFVDQLGLEHTAHLFQTLRKHNPDFPFSLNDPELCAKLLSSAERSELDLALPNLRLKTRARGL